MVLTFAEIDRHPKTHMKLQWTRNSQHTISNKENGLEGSERRIRRLQDGNVPFFYCVGTAVITQLHVFVSTHTHTSEFHCI